MGARLLTSAERDVSRLDGGGGGPLSPRSGLDNGTQSDFACRFRIRIRIRYRISASCYPRASSPTHTPVSDHDEAPPPKKAAPKAEGPASPRKRALLTILAITLLGAGAYGVRWYGPRWLASRDAKREGAALHRCLFGEPPQPKETPTRRLRRVFLTATGLVDAEKPNTTGTGWPGRCSAIGKALGEALVRAGKQDIAPPADFTKRVLDIAARQPDAAPLPLDALWEMADSQGGPREVPLPPSPAAPLDLDAPNLAERIAFVDFSTDPVPARGLRLAFRGDRGGGPLVCALPESLTEAHCDKLAERARSSRPSLWPAADDGAPALVLDRSAARSRFFRADTGQPFGEAFGVVGGFSAPPQMVGLVEAELGPRGEERALYLVRSEGDKRIDRVRIDPPPHVPFANVHVLGEALAWIEPREAKPHLLSRSLGRMKGPPGPIQDAGALPYEAMRLSACHPASGLAIVAQAKGSVWATFQDAAGTSPLVHADEPPRPARAVITSESIGCEAAAVSTTLVLRTSNGTEDAHEVRRVRCTKAACEAARVSLADLVSGRDPAERPAPADDDSSVVAATLENGLVLVAWRTATAGIRARIGKPEALAAAPDIVVYDEASDDVNGAGRVHAMRLFARKDAAILLLHGASGIKAIRIDARGELGAIQSSP